MKALVIGAGSMGCRRLRDLTHLKTGEVILFEPVPQRCSEISAFFGVRGFTKWEDALAEEPSVMVISTPPALHETYVRQAIDRKLHAFAEVPFVYEENVLAEIVAQAPSYPGTLGVSHTIRYYPPYRLIYDLLHEDAIGKPLYIEYSLGNYLPDWHTYENYRDFYAGDVRLGGAGMDMILHELNPIQWWMGPISTVAGRLSKVSSLEINGPDSHDALLVFECGATGFLHHDVIERGTLGRHVRIVGEDGTLEWHQNLPEVRLFEARSGENRQLPFDQAADWEEALAASQEVARVLAGQRVRSGQLPGQSGDAFHYESCYLREMRHFLDAALGKRPYSMASVKEELNTVRVFHAILRSNDQKREIAMGGSHAD